MNITKATTLEEAEAAVTQAVYSASVKILEALEAAELIRGNGHHAALVLASEARDAVRARWKSTSKDTFDKDPE